MTKEKQLMKLCKKFIDDMDITCAETVAQTDRVQENSIDFIIHICDIAGYKPYAD